MFHWSTVYCEQPCALYIIDLCMFKQRNPCNLDLYMKYLALYCFICQLIHIVYTYFDVWGVGIWQELGDMGSVKSTNHPLTQNHWSFKIQLYLYNGLHIVLSLYLIGFRFEIYSCQIVVSRQVEGIEILTVFTIAVSPVYVAVTCNT